MQYDPHYRYSGSNRWPLQNYADMFHFAVRCALRGQSLALSGRSFSALADRQANAELRGQGWTFHPVPLVTKSGAPTEEFYAGLSCLTWEGGGLLVQGVIEAGLPYYPALKADFLKAMAERRH